MTKWIIAAALAAQLADLGYSCRQLARGGHETNPMMPSSCRGLAVMKTGYLLPITFLPGKTRTYYAAGMAASGTFAVTMTWQLTKPKAKQ